MVSHEEFARDSIEHHFGVMTNLLFDHFVDGSHRRHERLGPTRVSQVRVPAVLILGESRTVGYEVKASFTGVVSAGCWGHSLEEREGSKSQRE